MFFEFEPAARAWFELATVSRLSVHDRRGTGLSDDMGGLPDLETRAADLLAVLDATGAEHPTILASGDGGMVAALLAATHPERVARLVWFQAQARSVQGPGWPHGRRRDDVEHLAGAAEATWGTPAFVEEMYPYGAMDEVEFLARMQRHACGPATAVRFIRLLHEYDVRDVLPTLRLPVLAVAPAGLADDWLYEQALATAALVPGAACRPLPAEAARLWHPSVIEETLAFCGVGRPPPEVESVLSTVLFTDIVGSTETQARVGDRAWKDLSASSPRDGSRGARPMAREGERHGRRRLLRDVRRPGACDPVRAGGDRARTRARHRGANRHPHRRVRSSSRASAPA